jgi:hypothetical protein
VSINRELSETENKIYLIFSLIFEKIMDEQGYQMGSYTSKMMDYRRDWQECLKNLEGYH